MKAAPETLETLEVITSPKNFDATVFKAFRRLLLPSIPVEVIKSVDFHDRFWIVNERRGFVVGTSINSFGNKHFFIQDDFLSDFDIKRESPSIDLRKRFIYDETH